MSANYVGKHCTDLSLGPIIPSDMFCGIRVLEFSSLVSLVNPPRSYILPGSNLFIKQVDIVEVNPQYRELQ